MSSVLEIFDHKQATQVFPSETLVRLCQHWETLRWSETCVLNCYIIQTYVVPNYHIESTDCWLCTLGLWSLRLHDLTLEQLVGQWGRVSLKFQKPNLEEYVTLGLYIKSMH